MIQYTWCDFCTFITYNVVMYFSTKLSYGYPCQIFSIAWQIDSETVPGLIFLWRFDWDTSHLPPPPHTSSWLLLPPRWCTSSNWLKWYHWRRLIQIRTVKVVSRARISVLSLESRRPVRSAPAAIWWRFHCSSSCLQFSKSSRTEIACVSQT